MLTSPHRDRLQKGLQEGAADGVDGIAPDEIPKAGSGEQVMAGAVATDSVSLRKHQQYRASMAFVAEFDRLTLKFQADVAEVLEPRSYQALLNLPPDERIVLSDPEIVERTYGRTDFNGGAS